MRQDPGWMRRTPKQRQQGDDAALAAVVGPQDEDAVLDRDDDDQRPQDEGQDPQHHVPGRGRRGWRHGAASFRA